jgi:hypothetical protein
MKKTLLFSLLLITLTSFAQDWAPFKLNDSTLNFLAQDSTISLNRVYQPIQTMKVDSSYSENSSLVKVFKKGVSGLKMTNQTHVSSVFWGFWQSSQERIKGKILGDTIKIFPDSSLVSTADGTGFSLRFPHDYTLGKTWTLGKSSSHLLIATVDSLYLDSSTYLISDSVSRIQISVLNSSNQLDTNHHFNTYILLSKSTGLIETIDFTELDTLFKFNQIRLSDISNNHNNTLTVGDEYYYEVYHSHSSPYITNYGSGPLLHRMKVIKDTLIGSNRILTFLHHYQPGWQFIYPNLGNSDTLTRTFNVNSIYSKMESGIVKGTLMLFQNLSTDFFGISKSTEFSDLFHATKANIIYMGGNNYYTAIYQPFERFHETLSIVGMDEEYEHNQSQPSLYQSNKNIIYVKKGSQSWGTKPNILTSIDDLAKMTKIKLYPNPVNDILTLSFNDKNYLVRIFSIDGKLKMQPVVSDKTF